VAQPAIEVICALRFPSVQVYGTKAVSAVKISVASEHIDLRDIFLGGSAQKAHHNNSHKARRFADHRSAFRTVSSTWNSPRGYQIDGPSSFQSELLCRPTSNATVVTTPLHKLP
jgi:hypothetical protein